MTKYDHCAVNQRIRAKIGTWNKIILQRKQVSWTFKKVLIFFCFCILLVLCFTLYSEVRPKTTNHHSHNCNYCINTKQHTGDAQKRVWLEWNMEEVTVRNRKEKQNANIHSKKKKVTTRFFFPFPFFFLWALVFNAVSHNDLTQKDVFTQWQQTGVTEEVNRHVPWGWRQILLQGGEKKRQRGSRWDKLDFWFCVDIECSHTCLPKTKKAPDFRHPDEVLNHK